MAKKRYINTKFWSDGYIGELEPMDRYLFLYLLTNEHTDICGIYEITFRTISFETGIDLDRLSKTMERFSNDKKIYYVDGWVCIKNFSKHQAVNDKIKIGIKRSLSEIPQQIIDKMIAYDSLSIDCQLLKLKLKLKLKTLGDKSPKSNPLKETTMGQVRLEDESMTYTDEYAKPTKRKGRADADLLELFRLFHDTNNPQIDALNNTDRKNGQWLIDHEGLPEVMAAARYAIEQMKVDKFALSITNPTQLRNKYAQLTNKINPPK